MSTAPQEKPTSQIARLKKTMPVATSRFHDALDQLECELVRPCPDVALWSRDVALTMH